MFKSCSLHGLKILRSHGLFMFFSADHIFPRPGLVVGPCVAAWGPQEGSAVSGSHLCGKSPAALDLSARGEFKKPYANRFHKSPKI